jgi:hypothetical protein
VAAAAISQVIGQRGHRSACGALIDGPFFVSGIFFGWLMLAGSSAWVGKHRYTNCT